MEQFLALHHQDWDNAINITAFTSMCSALFRNAMDKPYQMNSKHIIELFNIFNVSGSGFMSKQEFTFCWNHWIAKILKPKSVFVIVDVQNDFISGSLPISSCPAGHHGEDVIEPINKLLDSVPFDVFCYSQDWHPADHASFVDNVHLRKLHANSKIQNPEDVAPFDTVLFEGPAGEQTVYPRHCVQDTWGAELHKDLKMHPKGTVVYKATNPIVDAYSAFFDNAKVGKTALEKIIRKEGCTDVYVCGIATDVCVGSTAIQANELGFRTVLVEDCSRGINDDNIGTTLEKIREENGCVVNSEEVKAMVEGHDRRPELGIKLALNCPKNMLINKIHEYPKL